MAIVNIIDYVLYTNAAIGNSIYSPKKLFDQNIICDRLFLIILPEEASLSY